jgi:ElaA protein
MNWTVQKIVSMDATTLYEIIKLRFDVFIIEQSCFYEEFDNKDLEAVHVYGRDDRDKIIAYLRILEPGVSFAEVSIGRVVVSSEYRKEGIGRDLMQMGLKAVRDLYGDVPVRISAQAYLQAFYRSLGFETQSEIYMEDDIPHIEMLFNP